MDVNQGELVINITDSGSGFDHQKQVLSMNKSKARAGRGVSLVSSLCKELVYLGNGNQVRAIYQWKKSAA